MVRDELFISYSHRDRHWVDELIITFAPLVRKRKISIWDDTRVTIGARWREEIANALSRAKIALLLVSRYFLHSEFIAQNELPPLLHAAEKEGLTIFWIPIGYSLYEESEIAEYQATSDPSRPLNALSESDRDFELVKIAKAIDRIFEVASKPETQALLESLHPGVSSELGLLHGSDERSEKPMSTHERLHQALAEGKSAWRSVDALSAKAGITAEETIQLLSEDPTVELGRGKSGRTIARLQIPVG